MKNLQITFNQNINTKFDIKKQQNGSKQHQDKKQELQTTKSTNSQKLLSDFNSFHCRN